MNETVKNLLLCLTKCLICWAIMFVAWAIGRFVGDTAVRIVAIFTAIGIYGFFMAANLIFTVVIKLSADKLKAKTAHRLGEKLKNKVQSNYAKARRAVAAVLAFAYIYAILMTVCVMTVVAGVVASGMSVGTSVIATLAIALLAYPFVDVFFGVVESPIPSDRYELDPQTFPMLYGIAKDAAKKLGCSMPVRIFAAGPGAAVSVYRSSVILCLDYVHAAKLTRAEMYNVMLHEMAHVVNRDSARGRAYARAEAMFSCGNDKASQTVAVLTTILPSTLVTLAVRTYDILASRKHEIDADDAVAEVGDKQTYVNALAKSRVIMMFADMPRRELDFDFYRPETPTGDYAAQELALFDVYRDKYIDRWKRVLDNEIPAQVDSHPTFKMRREAFGCERYDFDVEETDENYKAEQAEIVRLSDNAMSAQNTIFYTTMREQNFVEPDRIMREYAEAVEQGEQVSEEKKLKAMHTYYGIDNAAALEIADGILASTPDAPTANFAKGLILFAEFDDECLPCLERAGKSAQYADPALDLIGKYYLLTGKQTEIDDYRKNADELTQRVFDTERGARITRKTVFVRADIDGQTESALVERIRTETRLKVTRIYIAKFTDGMNNAHYPVLLVFKRISSPELIADELNAAFNAIASFSDKYDFIPCYGKAGFCRKIMRADGALRYDADAKLNR